MGGFVAFLRVLFSASRRRAGETAEEEDARIHAQNELEEEELEIEEEEEEEE